MGELMGDGWIYRIDVKGLSDDVRREIVKRVKNKLGYSGALEALGIARGSLFNYLHGIRRVPDDVIRKALHYLDESEFNQIVQGYDRLRAVGIVRDDGSIDYSLILQAVALASKDEYLKQAILRFAVEHFREDLRRMLGLVPTTIKLTWDKGFEEFLRERKKRMKIKSEGTMKYYRNLFRKHLEGKVLSQDLIDYVISHPVKWLRNVFRHYIQYLFFKRVISGESYGWIMEYVPSRSYKVEPKVYEINIEDVKKTLEYLRKNRELYYTIYLLMLYSGLFRPS